MIRQKILYGAGETGKRAYEHYSKDNSDSVYCFADKYKHGTDFCGKKVISLNEMSEIYGGFDIVLCLYDVFDVRVDFEEIGICDFNIWHDGVPTQKADLALYFDELYRLKKQEYGKKVILYGAGFFGEIAHGLYKDRVVAFADKSKCGSVFCGKKVISPDEAAALSRDCDTVVCVRDYAEVVRYLEGARVKNYSVLFDLEDDLRTEFISRKSFTRGTIASRDIVDELAEIDFIQSPEIIDDYYDKYFAFARKCFSVKSGRAAAVDYSLSENYYYGFFDGLRDYCGSDVRRYESPAVSHGYPVVGTRASVTFPNIICAGELMRDYVRRECNDCLYFSVGAYLNYIESFYGEEKVVHLKSQNGKTLTVFAVHSATGTDLRYDTDEFYEIVSEESKNFDSLTVCVYFTEYKSEMTKRFESMGARIVSAGFSCDLSFAKRLKTILLLSDAVLTNGLGSHVNHALSLNIPVKLTPQKIDVNSVKNDDYIKAIYNDSGLKLRAVLENADYQITHEQLDAYEPSTGIKIKKTKEEIGAIFDLSRHIIQSCNYQKSKYADAVLAAYSDLKYSTNPNDKLKSRLMREALD